MNEKLSYRSHVIDLELIEIRPQRFHWLYAIDATHLNKSRDILQPLDMARADALVMAYREINVLEEIAATTGPARIAWDRRAKRRDDGRKSWGIADGAR